MTQKDTDLHGMKTDPMVLKDANGRYFIGRLVYDAMYDKWYSDPQERMEAPKYKCFSDALTDLILENLGQTKHPQLVRGQFIEQS